jgi:hypothetical protein
VLKLTPISNTAIKDEPLQVSSTIQATTESFEYKIDQQEQDQDLQLTPQELLPDAIEAICGNESFNPAGSLNDQAGRQGGQQFRSADTAPQNQSNETSRSDFANYLLPFAKELDQLKSFLLDQGGAGMSFNYQLPHGSQVGIEVQRLASGAIELLFTPQADRDREALHKQQQEIIASLSEQGLNVARIEIR